MFYSLTQLSNHPILLLFMVEFFQRISWLVQLCFYNKRFKNELFVKCTTEVWNLISVVHWTCFIMSCAIIASKYIWNGSIFARRLNNHLVTVFFLSSCLCKNLAINNTEWMTQGLLPCSKDFLPKSKDTLICFVFKTRIIIYYQSGPQFFQMRIYLPDKLLSSR